MVITKGKRSSLIKLFDKTKPPSRNWRGFDMQKKEFEKSNPFKKLARPRRFELLTFWSVVRCSIQLSYERLNENTYYSKKIKKQDFFSKKVILFTNNLTKWIILCLKSDSFIKNFFTKPTDSVKQCWIYFYF